MSGPEGLDVTSSDSTGAPLNNRNVDEDTSSRPPAWRRLTAHSTIWILLVLVVLVAGFSIARPGQFATTFNLANVATDAAGLLIIAVGQTFVITTAGIDLSVGSVLVFSAVISAKVTLATAGIDANTYGQVDSGWGPILLGLLAALAVGLGWGAVNGVLVAKARVPALIVTLGTLGMALGFAQIITGGTDIRAIPTTLVNRVGNGRVFGAIPVLVVIAVVIALAGAGILALTRFGRYTYAVGSNAEAARRCGIAVTAHLIKIYALSGLLAGLAGWLSLARFSTTTIGGHTTDNLSTIAAVVLGGTSLFGGIGTIVGTVIGVFIPSVLQNGFVILGVQPFWQGVAIGAVLIAAVYFDQLKRRARNRD